MVAVGVSASSQAVTQILTAPSRGTSQARGDPLGCGFLQRLCTALGAV